MKTTLTSSFDANLHNPNTATTAGFFSSILRRLLCSGSLRTHPFDCVKDISVVHHTEVKTEGSVTPGLVARLMGLETMPELSYEPKTNRSNKDSICRSRSANAADYRGEYDLTREQHRRLKSSSSFREIPSFLQQEDDEFLVFSFENAHDGGNGNKENRTQTQERKTEGQDSKKNNCDNKIGKRRRKISNRRSQIGRECDKVQHHSSNTSTKPKSPSETSQEEENSPCAAEKADLSSNAENSSPVSVLDLVEFVSEPESPVSEEQSREKASNSRRKLSTDLLNFEHFSSNSTHISITDARESTYNSVQVNGSRKIECCTEDYLAAWAEVCRLAEEDLQKPNWIKRDVSTMDAYEEIRLEFGLQIFDELLYELVAELVVV